jgi:rhamnogalacturonyl hydrolase YesR
LHRGHLSGPIPESSAHWGRGNGWFLYGVRGVLEDLPPDHPARTEFQSMLAAGLEGLLRHQGPYGLWHNVVTATEGLSRQDSCGAWMYIAVYARAYWKGWLRDERIPPMCERAWTGLKTKLWRGLLLAQCCGTGCLASRALYLERAHTRFPGAPALHAWIELQRMRKARQRTPEAPSSSARF